MVDPNESLYEVQGDDTYDTLTTQQELRKTIEVDPSLPRGPVTDGKCVYSVDPDTLSDFETPKNRKPLGGYCRSFSL
jgi:hypothetical protein